MGVCISVLLCIVCSVSAFTRIHMNRWSREMMQQFTLCSDVSVHLQEEIIRPWLRHAKLCAPNVNQYFSHPYYKITKKTVQHDGLIISEHIPTCEHLHMWCWEYHKRVLFTWSLTMINGKQEPIWRNHKRPISGLQSLAVHSCSCSDWLLWV